MRKRLAFDDESGVVLLLALGFIAFIGVIAVVLVNYATTSLRATVSVRTTRSAQFSADAAVDGAINAVRLNRAFASPFTVLLNQQGVTQNLRVEWPPITGPPTSTDHVSFVACLNTGSPCAAAATILAATVDFRRNVPAGATVPVKVISWSVKK
jgi:hypothetical protein